MTDASATPWTALYPPGVPREIDVRFATMLDLWQDAVDRRRDAPAVHYFDDDLTYGQLDAESDALASALSESGVRAGDRVGILLQNDPQWPVALLGTWKAGAVAVSLSPMLRSRELTFQLADCGAAALIALGSLYVEVTDAVRDSDVHTVLVTDPQDWTSNAAPHPVVGPPVGAIEGTLSLRAEIDERLERPAPARPALAPDDVAVLTYTSGTTGPPKGAMITHGGLCHNCQVPALWFDLQADEPVLGMAPLFHVTGLVLHMGLSWYTGAALILGHRFDPDEILTSIERRRPRFAIAAITAFVALLNHEHFADHDLSSLRIVASGGAPVTLGVVKRFHAATGLTISSVYGLTETTSPTHLTPPGSEPPVDPESGALSVGVPIPGARAQILDTDSGTGCPPGTIGEITVAGPMVVPGYWGRPEQSANAIPDGTLLTGDVGLMTEAGWFFVVDRKKDLIVASGYKVWPREVEEVLHEHPSVREAAVIGVPDEYRGETVVAWVVPVAGVAVDEGELIEFCRRELAAYKYPRRITFVEAIPKNTAGKVLRRELRGNEA